MLKGLVEAWPSGSEDPEVAQESVATALASFDRLTTRIATAQLLVSAYAWGDFLKQEFLDGFRDIVWEEWEHVRQLDEMVLPAGHLHLIRAVLAGLAAIPPVAVQLKAEAPSSMRSAFCEQLMSLFEQVDHARDRLLRTVLG